MERTNKQLRDERIAVGTDEQEKGTRDVRALAELELMLVGGGGDTPDWGG